MSPAARPQEEDFAGTHQLAPTFLTANPATSPTDTDSVAPVIPLNRKADSSTDIGYDTPPPPVIVPYGWRLVRRDDGWLLTHDDAEWSTIERIIRERRSGDSYRAIAARLADENVPAPTTGRSHGRWDGTAGTERCRILVLHYAPDVAAYRGPRGAGLPGPMPGAPSLDDFDRLQRRGAELGLVDDGEE